MSFGPREYLLHIGEEVEYLRAESKGMTFADFEASPTKRRAFVRSLEIIGEAVKKLPPDLLATEPQIPWHSIARMRDRLIHGYFAVDYELVWDVVTSRIPDLRAAARRLLDASE